MQRNKIESSLYFDKYIINKIYFQNNYKFEGNETPVEFSIEPNITITNDEKNMIVELTVDIFPNAIKNNYPFEMNIVITGYFSMNTPEENILKYKRNAIAILYPYVRAIMSSYTAIANVNSLLLPAININKLIDYQNAEKKSEV